MKIRVIVDVEVAGTDDTEEALDMAVDEINQLLRVSTNDQVTFADVYEYEEF